jgi:hypothetical protein
MEVELSSHRGSGRFARKYEVPSEIIVYFGQELLRCQKWLWTLSERILHTEW